MSQTMKTAGPSLRLRPSRDRRPAWIAGAAGAVLASAIGLLVCGGLTVVTWLSTDGGTADGVLRAGAIGWLSAHGSGVAVGHLVVNAVPLGLTMFVVALLYGTVVRVSLGYGVEPGWRAAVSVAAGCAVAYAGVLALVAWWSDLGAVGVAPWRAALVGAVVGLVCGATGAVRANGLLGRQYAALPALVRSAVRGACWGAVALLAVAAGMVLVGLVVRIDAAGAMWDGLRPDLLGGIALLLLCVLVLPNLVLWNVAALLGPGYALGAGTSVTLTSSSLGAVPALPVLAALPPAGERPGWLVALAAAPLLAGALAGYLTIARTPTDLWTAVSVGAGSGALAGSALGLGLLLSGGAIGPGRLGHSGPDLVVAVPLAIVVLAVGGAVGAAAAHYRGRRGADDDAAATTTDSASDG